MLWFKFEVIFETILGGGGGGGDNKANSVLGLSAETIVPYIIHDFFFL
jgi:hypothetical protein